MPLPQGRATHAFELGEELLCFAGDVLDDGDQAPVLALLDEDGEAAGLRTVHRVVARHFLLLLLLLLRRLFRRRCVRDRGGVRLGVRPAARCCRRSSGGVADVPTIYRALDLGLCTPRRRHRCNRRTLCPARHGLRHPLAVRDELRVTFGRKVALQADEGALQLAQVKQLRLRAARRAAPRLRHLLVALEIPIHLAKRALHFTHRPRLVVQRDFD